MASDGRKRPLNPFSPWRSSPESLRQTIVGRDYIIKSILEKTDGFCGGRPAKHCLLIGRRGLGKTHLLSLLYHYYEKKSIMPEFASLSDNVLPVIFLEEERYSLNSLARFLIKMFGKFSEKVPAGGKWAIPDYIETDEEVIEYCFESLKNISNSENKKIIILCDNLEEVFRQWGEREYKSLRVFLSDQQAVMIIGTAVRVFEEIISPRQPFYEFFERVPLVDLSDEQMLEVLKRRFTGDRLEQEFKGKEKHLRNKVAAIARLTGGNPRLVVFLYDIVTRGNVFEIENAIEELMESLSEYFRNRFEDLGPQERTILDTFADMDGPASPKEISKKTRIKEQSTRTHIKRLKDAGYINNVEYGKRRESKYDVTERLFRLWRQTATISGRKKFKILIKFLKFYFTPEELREGRLNATYQFRTDPSETEKRLKKDPENWDARMMHLINRGCLGEFGDNMEGLAGMISREELNESRITSTTDFILFLMENCRKKGHTQTETGLYLTLLKLNQWHGVDHVQNTIALHLRKLVDTGNRELFINAVDAAREQIQEPDLLELLKAFLYAGKYLKEGNKVILEEVFPEIRDIIFDIVEKFEKI